MKFLIITFLNDILKKITLLELYMRVIACLFLIFSMFSGFNTAMAGQCGDCTQGKGKCVQECDNCCNLMGGVSYCDSSAGRLVCKNGFYSSCYCTRHAVMDLDHVQGCCLWQGGVLKIDPGTGLVICNSGGVSEVCTLANPPQSVSSW